MPCYGTGIMAHRLARCLSLTVASRPERPRPAMWTVSVRPSVEVNLDLRSRGQRGRAIRDVGRSAALSGADRATAGQYGCSRPAPRGDGREFARDPLLFRKGVCLIQTLRSVAWDTSLQSKAVWGS